MTDIKHRGIARLWHATTYSLSGIRSAWQNEAAFRQECILATILAPFAMWLGTSAVERVLLIASCLIVLVTELLNSAIEATIDRIGDEPHPLSGRAKDLGSAAVFISLWLVLITWGAIAYQRFLG
jgi:diacylglycerol kinase (ATP)